jgi:hypothetical protein
MMKVALVIDFYIRGELQDGVWKVVDMPCLPPIGTRVWLDEHDNGMRMDGDVEAIEWWEPRDYFEVHIKLGERDFDDELENVVERLAEAGWKHEAAESLTENHGTPQQPPICQPDPPLPSLDRCTVIGR